MLPELNSIDQLPKAGHIWLYGAGSVGHLMAMIIESQRPGLEVEFLDSFKTGSFLDRPMHRFSDFAEDADRGQCIIITSSFNLEIGRSLTEQGFDNFLDANDFVRYHQRTGAVIPPSESRQRIATLLESHDDLEAAWSLYDEAASLGLFRQALEYLEVLREHVGDDLKVHRAFAFCYDCIDDRPKLLAHCDRILKEVPDDQDALIYRAKLMLYLDSIPDVAGSAQSLVGIDQDEARKWVHHALVRLRNHAQQPDRLNIGGGGAFHYNGWLNLDAVESPLNPKPFLFSPEMTFPLEKGSISLAYTSHAIEHLDDATVDRVLSETARTLRSDGFLIVKIPDFDKVLRALADRQTAFFHDYWDLNRIVPTWSRRSVEDTLESRAATIFCGFWNEAFGGFNALFSAKDEMKLGAYFGPPGLPQHRFKEILSGASPHQMAVELREIAMRDEKDTFYFNHQNAWGRAELKALLRRHGFVVLSDDAEQICSRFALVPTLRDMFEISLYVVAAVDGDARIVTV